ncbi:MAG: acyltransferase [Anaerolineae bacterium]|nr:acyltransferase [Anaerolineae bacterium]
MRASVYFPGLNAIRAYAALSVVIHHLGRVGHDWHFTAGRQNYYLLDFFFLYGWDSVTCFFVLSGFLITYLLLVERQQTNDIAVKAFYIRRILRIWPLYYLITFLGLIVLPVLTAHTYPVNLIPQDAALIIFLLPNIPFALKSIGVLAPVWSIGVEEQFYLAWPLLVKYGRSLVGVVVAVIAIKWLVLALADETLYKILVYARFECMAVGAFAAWLLFKKHWVLRVIYHPALQIALIVAIICAAISDGYAMPAYDFGIAVIFALFILNIASNPRSILKLESPLANWLGKISYGIYMYHAPVIYLLLIANLRDVPLYFFGIAITLLVAHLSYNYLEKPFLHLKEKFSQIPSTSTASSTVSTTP